MKSTGTVTMRVLIGPSAVVVANWNVKYDPSKINPKWARLITLRKPQVKESPRAIRAKRLPPKAPASPACRTLRRFIWLGSPLSQGGA
jgi:hypothetical protein